MRKAMWWYTEKGHVSSVHISAGQRRTLYGTARSIHDNMTEGEGGITCKLCLRLYSKKNNSQVEKGV